MRLCCGYLHLLLLFASIGWWGIQWGLAARAFLRGGNTAPLYLRVGLNSAGTTIEELKLRAKSQATGAEVLPELVATEADKATFVWKWVLLRHGSVVIDGLRTEGVLSVEWAYDADCRNEAAVVPLDLSWTSLVLPAHFDSPRSVAVPIPARSRSLLPLKLAGGCLNWGGDARFLLETLPAKTFPYLPFVTVWLVLVLISNIADWLNRPELSRDAGLKCRLESDDAKSRVWLSSVIMVSCTVLGAIFLNPVFNVNDDLQMQCVLNGYFGFSQDPHALYMNSGLGGVLALLCWLHDGTPWYSLSLFVALAWGWLLIVVAIRNVARNDSLSWFHVGVLLPICAVQPFTNLTFTLVSEIITLGGVLGVISFSMCATSRSNGRKKLLLMSCCGAIFVGFLLRFDSALLVCITLFPSFMVFCASVPQLAYMFSVDRFRSLFRYVCVSAMLCVIFYVADKQYYALSDGWSSWRAINNDWAEILDYRRGRSRTDSGQHAVSGAVAWSNTELRLLENSFLLDRKFQDRAALAVLLQGGDDQGPGEMFFRLVSRGSSLLVEVMTSLPGAIVWVTLFPLGLIGWSVSPSLGRGVVFSYLWPAILMVLISTYFKPVPYRVSYGIALGCCCTSSFCMLATRHVAGCRQWFLERSCYLVMVAISCYSLWYHVESSFTRGKQGSEFAAETTRFLLSSEPVLVHLFPNGTQPVFADLSFLAKSRAIPCGYLAATPVARSARGAIGVEESVGILRSTGRLRIVSAAGVGSLPVDELSGLLELYFAERIGRRVLVRKNDVGRWWTAFDVCLVEGDLRDSRPQVPRLGG